MPTAGRRPFSALPARSRPMSGLHLIQLGRSLASKRRRPPALPICSSLYLLHAVAPKPRQMPVPVFDVRTIEDVCAAELLLVDRYQAPSRAADEPLILDDVLVQPDAHSRVVHLFDPALDAHGGPAECANPAPPGRGCAAARTPGCLTGLARGSRRIRRSLR